MSKAAATVMERAAPLLQSLVDLESHMPKHAVSNENVSRWSVGRHVGHCLLATRGICRAVARSEPYEQRIRKGLIRRLVFLTGRIPRGRGRAPEASVMTPETTLAGLEELLEEARAAVKEGAAAARDCWWEHFLFGVMKRDEALQFAGIHNRHHLRILSDILSRR